MLAGFGPATAAAEPPEVAEPRAVPPIADAGDVVVRGVRARRPVLSQEVTREEARRVPGTFGDAVKVVENMPGVARPALGSGELVVWGAAAQDTRVYVDGLRLPRLYHEGGYRSVLHPDLVRSVELVPGGYGAAYGRGLGGIVTVRLRPLDEEGVHGTASVDVLDAGVSTRARLSEHLSVAIAARRSHLSDLVPAFTSRDVGEITPLPRYHDAQARVVLTLAPQETLELGGLFSSDAIDRSVPSADIAATRKESRALGFGLGYLRYDKRLDGGASVFVLTSVGLERRRLTNRFGAIPTEVATDGTLYGLRTGWRTSIAENLTMDAGLDLELARTNVRRAGSIGAPQREGDPRVFGQPLSDQLNADDWKTTTGSLAAHAEVDAALLGGQVHVTPGARFEPYLSATSRRSPKIGETPAVGVSGQDTAVEPRVAVRWAPAPRIAFKAAFGVYHQAALPEDLSAVFGTPTLGLAQARHFLMGGAFGLLPALDLEVTPFLTLSEDLVARSSAARPALASALAQTGLGRAYGTQLLVRLRKVGRFRGWVAYTMSRSQRRDTPDSRWRLFDGDQTHVLTALASCDLGRGFEAGIRVRAASGMPRTPVLRAYYDLLADAYQPVFGPTNTTRLPAFFAADLRLAKHFAVAGGEAEAYLDLQNATAHRNVEEVVYDPSYLRSDTISGLPILPVVGGRWSW
ncbi:TonB-dependent receptor plug domain-containing protein [soil metagenome]